MVIRCSSPRLAIPLFPLAFGTYVLPCACVIHAHVQLCRFLTSVPPTHILPLHFDYSTPTATATVDLGLHLAPASRPVLSLIKDVWRSVIWTLDIDSIEYNEAGGYEADLHPNAQYHQYVPPQYRYAHSRDGARAADGTMGGTDDPAAGHGPGGTGAFTEGSSAHRLAALASGGQRLLPAGQRVSPWTPPLWCLPRIF